MLKPALTIRSSVVCKDSKATARRSAPLALLESGNAQGFVFIAGENAISYGGGYRQNK
jgi:hypothetical protein